MLYSKRLRERERNGEKEKQVKEKERNAEIKQQRLRALVRLLPAFEAHKIQHCFWSFITFSNLSPSLSLSPSPLVVFAFEVTLVFSLIFLFFFLLGFRCKCSYFSAFMYLKNTIFFSTLGSLSLSLQYFLRILQEFFFFFFFKTQQKY